jgi:hypothetical protein
MNSKAILKSILVLIILIISNANLKASHGAGGSVSAEYLGQHQYKITAKFHWNTPNLGNNGILFSACGSFPQGMIIDSVRVFQGVCGALTYEFTASKTITLVSIPVSGCEISVYLNTCCLEFSTNLTGAPANAYYMRIFPGSKLNGAGASPKFIVPFIKSYVQSPIMKYCFNAYDTDDYDSLYYALDDAFGLPGIVYRTGYSKSHPFGDTVATVLNPNTGILTSQSPNLNVWGAGGPGAYLVSTRVESYSNGILHYINYRSHVITVVPAVAAGTTQVNLTNVNVQNGVQVGVTEFEIEEGGVLEFDVNNYLTANQTLKSVAYGKDLSVLNGGLSTKSDAASYSFPSGTGTGVGYVPGIFKFQPNLDFVDTTHAFRNTQFIFRVSSDDSCGSKEDYIAVNVKVLNSPKTIYASIYDVNQCGSNPGLIQILGDTSNLIWSPSIGVSDTLGASVLLNPNANTVYTVTNLNDSSQLTIDLNYFPDNFALVSNGSLLSLPTFIDSSTVSWYYNGLFIGSGFNTVNANVSGYYWAISSNFECKSYSDTIKNIALDEIVVVNVNASIQTDLVQMDYSELEITLTKDLNVGEVSFVVPETFISDLNSSVELQIFEKGQTQPILVALLNHDGNLRVFKPGLSFQLQQGKDYIFKLDFPDWNVGRLVPQTWPSTSSDGSILVQSGFGVNSGGDTLSNEYIPFVIGLNSSISIGENSALDFKMYPNPAENNVFIEGVTGELTLYTLNGTKLQSTTVSKSTQLDLSAYPKGVYFVEALSQKGRVVRKLVLQ